jgi:tRNA A37 threonylcarbamoyladenosine dehydratase
MTSVARQFASTARLFSEEAFFRLRQAHVGVVGLGGVGSWAAEALARSGVGRLTLVDMDVVAESNINRQAQASHATKGMAKVEAMAERLRGIDPQIDLTLVDAFLSLENIDILFGENTAEAAAQGKPSFWIDACDDYEAKLLMVRYFRQRERPRHLIVSGGAGGKTDPTWVRVGDLAKTFHDPLLAKLRKTLKGKPGFPGEGKLFVPVVHSDQPMRHGADCDPSARLACAGYGSMVTVTAAMGFAAASHAISVVITNPDNG